MVTVPTQQLTLAESAILETRLGALVYLDEMTLEGSSTCLRCGAQVERRYLQHEIVFKTLIFECVLGHKIRFFIDVVFWGGS